ncbi:MAG: glycine zipper family protein [Sulfuritalea sp.]|nr:glycine zipper family protein [Sulfuritalea sp.]
MNASIPLLVAASAVALLAGCAVAPAGPSVMALPGSGKNFEQFRADDADCRRYAREQTGGSDANQAATDAGVRSAAVGTVVGAVAGAAIGGRDSAGVGAGTGLLVGSMAGTGAARSSAYATQRHYDNAYVQCMYAKGQQVPVSGAAARSRTQAPAQPAAPAGTYYPPPPPGQVPPPGTVPH